jgi:hypothetical protein
LVADQLLHHVTHDRLGRPLRRSRIKRRLRLVLDQKLNALGRLTPGQLRGQDQRANADRGRPRGRLVSGADPAKGLRVGHDRLEALECARNQEDIWLRSTESGFTRRTSNSEYLSVDIYGATVAD